jgi:hypothetical protein
MPHFKNSKNQLFWLDAQDNPTDWLGVDCVEISEQTSAAIRAEIQSAQFDGLTYAEKRQAEYPPASDYLDGIVKGDTAQVNAYIAACLAVKAKYPKV